MPSKAGRILGKPAVLTALLAATLALAEYSPAYAPSRQLAGGDLLAHAYPLGRQVALELRAGSLIPAARDPSRALGVPLAADPLAWTYYPPRLLHALLPYDLGFKLALALHAAVAGLGASWLARALGARGRARLLAVVGTALAGPLLSAHRQPDVLASAAWAPWAAAASLEAIGVRGQERQVRLALAAVFWALLLLGGGFPVALGLALVLAFAAAGATSLEHVASSWERRVLEARAFFALLPAILLGAGLASLGLVPAAIWACQTTRVRGVPEGEALHHSLEPARLPGFFARLLDPGGAQEHRLAASSLPTVYLGAGVVACALAGIALGGRRARSLALGTAVVLVLSLGASGRLFVELRALPLGDRLCEPERLVPLAAALVPALAAAGASALARRAPRRAWLVGVLVAVTALDLLLARRTSLRTVPLSWLETAPATTALVDTGRVLAEPRLLDSHISDEPASDEGFLAAKEHERRTLAGGLAGLWGKESASVDLPYPPARLQDLLVALDWDGRTWDLLSCGAVLADPRGAYRARIDGFPDEPRPGTCVSARQPVDISRAWLASTVIRWEHAGAFEIARCSPWPRGRRGPVAVVESDAVPELHEDLGADRVDRPELDQVSILERGADGERVATDSKGPRLLVLSELWTVGVRATVDGRPAEAAPADMALVGVPVPAGRHEVIVTWKTPGSLVGAFISLACAVLVARRLVRGGARCLEAVAPIPSSEPVVSLRAIVLGAFRRAAPEPRVSRTRVYFRESLARARSLPDEMFVLPASPPTAASPEPPAAPEPPPPSAPPPPPATPA